MPRRTDSNDSSFLGGGPRFNAAGDNAPMPGEKVAEAPEPLPFGGPRVWIGVLLIIILIAALWFFFGGNLAGTTHVGGNSKPNVTINGPGQANPDSPQ